MHSPEITKALNAVKAKYGAIQYYGSSPNDVHGAGFKIEGISATFSIHTQDGILQERYDLQIESTPPGDYIYTDVVTYYGLIEIISRFEKPEELWPSPSE